MTLLAAAIALGAQVGPVIPVRGKVPLWPDWPTRATRTPSDAPEWQTATGIGLVTGSRAGYFVLDVDGAPGAATLRALCAAHGDLPHTWTSHTGGGGAHLFFAWPDFAVRGSAGKLGEGLDVRGEGGQVVAPPSRHWIAENRRCDTCQVAGPAWHASECVRVRYVWAPGRAPADLPLATAPAWLLDLLRPRPALVPQPGPPRPAESDVLRRASKYLTKIPGAVEHSGGHDQAWKAALAVVRGFALSEADAYALLATDYNPRCAPPWSEKELRHKVKQASQSASVQWGYLRDAPRERPSVLAMVEAREEPGFDDDVPIPQAPRFRLERAAALLAENIPPTRWLLSPYVPAGSFGELVGPPGKGKTTFMAWMIMQMAAAGYRCAIIEEEGSRRGLQRLVRRALATVAPSAIDRVYFKHASRFNLRSEIDTHEMAEALVGMDFVLLDSFALVTPGMDEDKSKEMGPVVANAMHIVQRVGCALWMNHHSGKSHWRDGEVPKLGDGRGSSALPGALDAELSMRPCDSAEGYIEFDLFVTKMREGDDQVRPQHVRIDRSSPAAICEMNDLEIVASTSATAKQSAVDKLTDVLMRDVRVPTSFADAMPGGEIAKLLRVARADCIKAIKVLCDDGLFEANAVTAKPFKKYHRCMSDIDRSSHGNSVPGTPQAPFPTAGIVLRTIRSGTVATDADHGGTPASSAPDPEVEDLLSQLREEEPGDA